MKLIRLAGIMSLGTLLVYGTLAHAETRVTYKSAKTSSSYYQMAVQIAEGVVNSDVERTSADQAREAGHRFSGRGLIVPFEQRAESVSEKVRT